MTTLKMTPTKTFISIVLSVYHVNCKVLCEGLFWSIVLVWAVNLLALHARNAHNWRVENMKKEHYD